MVPMHLLHMQYISTMIYQATHTRKSIESEA